MFDRDNDGRISCTELGTIMRALGRSPTEAEVNEHIKRLDPKHTSFVHFADFANLMDELPPMDPMQVEKELVEAFRVFDREGTGIIPTAELRHIVTTLGEKLTEQEADEMVREADPDNSGTVDYAVFIKKLLSV